MDRSGLACFDRLQFSGAVFLKIMDVMFTLNDAALINHKHDCACLGAHRSRNFSASRFREETRKSKHMLSEKLL